MAGWMGTGTSTIAQALATATGAVVLDHDTTKTAILGAGVAHPPAGAASYSVLHAIAADLLAQGHSVILDSPSLYEPIPDIGARLAAAAGARYIFAECRCPDEIANDRVESRSSRPSQVATAAEAQAIRNDRRRTPTRRPATIVLDTTLPEEVSVRTLLDALSADDLDRPPSSGNQR